MGTDYFNTRFLRSLYLPYYVRDTTWNSKKINDSYLHSITNCQNIRKSRYIQKALKRFVDWFPHCQSMSNCEQLLPASGFYHFCYVLTSSMNSIYCEFFYRKTIVDVMLCRQLHLILIWILEKKILYSCTWTVSAMVVNSIPILYIFIFPLW